MKLETKFDINERIYIKELKTWGLIRAIYICGAGLEYSVKYFSEMNPKESYFLEDDLSSKKDADIIGYRTDNKSV